MQVIAVGTLTAAQQKQLTQDLLEFFYQAHRRAAQTPPPSTHPSAPAMVERQPPPA